MTKQEYDYIRQHKEDFIVDEKYQCPVCHKNFTNNGFSTHIFKQHIKADNGINHHGSQWGAVMQSRFIESALAGIHLPAFYFEEVSKRHWVILDGFCRCLSICNFCVKKTLALKGLEFVGDECEGMTYDDFSFLQRRELKMLPISVNLLQSKTPPDVRRALIERLS